MGGGCALEQWVSPIVRLPQEVNPSLRGTFCCPQVVGGYQAAESYKSLQCIIQRADNFDKLLWRPDYWTHPPLGGQTHRPQAVGAPAWWAGVNFPRVSNLHLRISVWYSRNWIGSGSIWSHFLTCRHQGRHQAAGEVGLASTSPPRVEKTTKRYSLAQLLHPSPLSNIFTARNEACWRAGQVRRSKIVVGLILLHWKGALCKARQITRFCPTPRVSQIIAKLQTNFRNIFLSTNCHNSWRNCIVISWFPFVFAPQVFSIQFLTTEHAARCFSDAVVSDFWFLSNCQKLCRRNENISCINAPSWFWSDGLADNIRVFLLSNSNLTRKTALSGNCRNISRDLVGWLGGGLAWCRIRQYPPFCPALRPRIPTTGIKADTFYGWGLIMQKLNFPLLPPNEPAACSAKRSNGKVWYQFANGKWFSLHRVEFWSIVLTKERFLFRLPFNQPQMVAAKIVFLRSLYAELGGKVFLSHIFYFSICGLHRAWGIWQSRRRWWCKQSLG